MNLTSEVSVKRIFSNAIFGWLSQNTKTPVFFLAADLGLAFSIYGAWS